MLSPGGRPIDESPLSASRSDNWIARNGGLPPYVRGIARGIAKKHGGKVTSRDIAMAWQYVKRLALTSKHPAVKAAAAAAVGQEKALQARAHSKKDLANVTYRLVDLAAAAGHHIKGTSYHWHHGWVPRDLDTARHYHKKFGGEGSEGYFNVEPEEFNGFKGTPKFYAGTHGATQPKMKYHKNKILSGHKFTNGKGEHLTVTHVSESATHVMDSNGKKHRISDLKPMDQTAKAALSNFQKKKFKSAIKTFHIQSSFQSTGKKQKTLPLPKHSAVVKEGKTSFSSTPIGKTYSAPPSIYHDEPTFPESKNYANLNIKAQLSHQEKNAVQGYTGSNYSWINRELRKGVTSDHTKMQVEAIDKAMAKATPLKEKPILHRGFNVQAIGALRPGDSFVEKGYSSTSRSPHIGFTKQTTRLHIESMDPKLKALDVKAISLHPGENEVLINRNTKYTVKRRVEHGSHTHLYVHAEPASAKDLVA